jgi:hypothetical protein
MDKYNYIYVIWQCILVLISGIVGFIAVCITPNLPRDISLMFGLVFILCIVVALFFLTWVRQRRREEEENRLIESIGEAE